MTIKTSQHSVRSLFEQHPTFQVPKYQRGYAWEQEAIDDFIEDISKCLTARVLGNKRHHFFGGIVTTKKDVPPSSRQNFEVIDGQQRLASFTMLVAAVICEAESLVNELDKKGTLNSDEKKAKKYFSETAEDLKARYLIYRDSVGLEYVPVPRLMLSDADAAFFLELINGEKVKVSRESHQRILDAWQRLSEFVNDKIISSKDYLGKAAQMRFLVNNVLGEDCTLIFMWSDERSEAFQIFQVLNDRGVHLTDGDLLRARTMERLDTPAHKKTQNDVAALWDQILVYPPKDTDDYLRWYFSSVEGVRPNPANLADQFLKDRFQCHDKESLSEKEAKILVAEIKKIREELSILDGLKQGTWPYSDKGKTVSWDWARLPMLVTHLKHTNAMPLLLALTKLDVNKFAEALCSLERFVFRYKVIGNAHINAATGLYIKHAKIIRDDPKSYKVKTLTEALSQLVMKAIPDKMFESLLKEKQYSKGAGNGYLRYFFITLEDYHTWYKSGANGQPKCQDKSKILDFNSITIEHVYPQNADVKDKKLEDVKDRIGNLTIFSPGNNDSTANKLFPAKKKTFQESMINLNQDIGKNADWTSDLVNKRTDDLAKRALKIFIP